MKKEFVGIVWVMVALVVGFAQVTPPSYVHPKPRPLTGNVTNYFQRTSQPIAPANYANENPVVWSIDGGGGLHSRKDASDRLALNTNVTEEGAIVYDASNRTYYGVETNLSAIKPLFTLDGTWLKIPPSFSTNIYNTDGFLTGNRVVSGGSTNSLTFTNLVVFQVRNVLTNTFGAGLEMNLRTPGVVGGTRTNGMLLSLINSTNGTIEFVPAPSSFSTNIYNSDGRLTGNRFVRGGSNTLAFTELNSFYVLDATNISLFAKGAMVLATPHVQLIGGSATNGQVLTLQDANSGRVEYANLPSTFATNIYNSDGVISGAANGIRTVHIGTNRLIFYDATGTLETSDLGRVSLGSKTNILWATEESQVGTQGGISNRFKMFTPRYGIGTANGQTLTLTDAANGLVDFYPANNLYNSNGILSSDRILNGFGRALSFTNLATLDSRAANHTLGGSTSLKLLTPNVQGGFSTNGQVLTLTSTNGTVEFATPAAPAQQVNIYNGNGKIESPQRFVDLSSNILSFINSAGSFDVNQVGFAGISSKTNVFYATEEAVVRGAQRFKMFTPRLGSVLNGQVLTMVDAPFGLVDFHPPYNLYSTNGTLTGNRIVDGNSRELSFTNLNVFSTRGTKTNQISGQYELDIRTPNVFNALAQSNQVLTLLDPSSGRSEFVTLPAPPTDINIYAMDGTVTAGGTRTVNVPANTTLRTLGSGTTILNTSINNISGVTNYLIGSDSTLIAGVNRFQLRTPRFYNSVAKDGDVLTMVNRAAGLGEADFYTPTNIYNNNGTLTGNRVVSGGNNNLTFSGLNLFQVNSPSVRLYTGTSGDMVLATPIIMGGAGGPAVNGWVLTLKDSVSGRVDFAPLPNPGGSTGDFSSIYANDGTIATNVTLSTRTVNHPGIRLLFNGSQNTGSAFDVSLANGGTGRFSTGAATNDLFSTALMRIGGSTATIINTPGTYANPASRAGWVLAWDGSKSEYVPVATGQDVSIYSTNGTLSSSRTLTGANFDMTWAGINNLDLRGTATTIGGSSALNFRTPGVAGSTIGQVLTAQANGTGQAEFQAPQNLYNSDGSISGTRTVTVNPGANLVFNGTGTFTTSTSLQTANIQATNVQTLATDTLFLTGQKHVSLFTPKMLGVGGQAVNGNVLTVTDNLNGYVDFQALPMDVSLYTTNGALTGTRTVSMGDFGLGFQGTSIANFIVGPIGTFYVNTTTASLIHSSGLAYISAGTKLQIRTPNVNGTGASLGQVLTLMATDGTVEYATPASAETLYLTNGYLRGPRTVSLNNNPLIFQGSGSFSATSLQSFTASAGNSTVNADQTLILQGSQLLKVITPNVIAGGANIGNGYVLTYNSTNQSADFKPPSGSGGTTTGKPEYYAEVDISGTASMMATITSDGVSPPYTGSMNSPVPYSRWLFRVRNMDTSYKGGSLYLRLSGTNTEYSVATSGQHRGSTNSTYSANPGIDEIKPGYLLECVFVPNFSPAGATSWVMVNAGYSGSAATSGLLGKTGLLPEEEVLSKPLKFSLPAVVDVRADLAELPLNFKKASTLGQDAVGDGHHADYYQTAYAFGFDSVQSLIDPQRMWKKLVPAP